jgi:hypothetical protein
MNRSLNRLSARRMRPRIFTARTLAGVEAGRLGPVFRNDPGRPYPQPVTDQETSVSAYMCRAVADRSMDRITSVDRLGPGENNAVYKVAYRNREGGVNQVLVRLGPRGAEGVCGLRARRWCWKGWRRGRSEVVRLQRR